MAKQHIITIKMKKIFIFLLGILSILLVSCVKEIPEGDIKEFVKKLDYDLAYQYVNTGKGTTTVKYYTFDVLGNNDGEGATKELKGQISSTTYINKTDGQYYYSIGEVTGDYIGDEEGLYNFSHRETLCYLDEYNQGIVYEITDGVLNEELKYTPEDVKLSVDSFFYSEVEANIHMGGYYYGDYIQINCAEYYQYFSLNEDKTKLTYSINLLTKNDDGDDILTTHNFTVNEYGLIINLESIARNNSKGIASETTIQCEYNIDIDKINKL
jgi:hypothetical protein